MQEMSVCNCPLPAQQPNGDVAAWIADALAPTQTPCCHFCFQTAFVTVDV